MSFQDLLPFAAACAETTHDLPEKLFPQEERAIARAGAARRAEFVAVRACAREALRQLGCARPALVARAGTGPTWPRGVAGSLTHTAGFRAAAASRSVRALGIDAEVAGRLSARAAERLLCARERQQDPKLDPTLLFSAKESTYKAWSALGRGSLLSSECEVCVQRSEPTRGGLAAGYLVVNVRTRAQEDVLIGAWSLEGGLFRTAVWA